MKKCLAALMIITALILTVCFVACGDPCKNGHQYGDDGKCTVCGKVKPADGPADDDKGVLTIGDITVYITSENSATFAKINPMFSVPSKAEDLTYGGYSKSYIKIENGIVTPVFARENEQTVTATSANFSASFKVKVKYINVNEGQCDEYYNYYSRFAGSVSQRGLRCKQSTTADSTVLIGDSFFDDSFVGSFLQVYAADKDLFNAGISSTTSTHWEACLSKVLTSETSPKNIVIHIGTNNFYDEHMTQTEVENSIQRLLMFIHTANPTSNVYWFNITQRTDNSYSSQVQSVNATMNNWCENSGFAVCVDSCSLLTSDKLRDGIHPTTEGYTLMMDALVKAGCEIAAK